MLKINASYSKKVPAESEYSSQSFHASIEAELPDGLTQEQLQERIHKTFEMVRQSVEAELHGKTASNPEDSTPPAPPQNQSRQQHQDYRAGGSDYGRGKSPAQETAASPKQISYLLLLASRRGITPAQLAVQNNVQDVQQLTRKQCSALIEQWRAA